MFELFMFDRASDSGKERENKVKIGHIYAQIRATFPEARVQIHPIFYLDSIASSNVRTIIFEKKIWTQVRNKDL